MYIESLLEEMHRGQHKLFGDKGFCSLLLAQATESSQNNLWDSDRMKWTKWLTARDTGRQQHAQYGAEGLTSRSVLGQGHQEVFHSEPQQASRLLDVPQTLGPGLNTARQSKAFASPKPDLAILKLRHVEQGL